MQQQQQQQTVEHGREPCPDRILDDIGGAFGMGALGGGCWHMYRGLKNSPKGYKMLGALDVSGPAAGSSNAAHAPGAWSHCCSFGVENQLACLHQLTV